MDFVQRKYHPMLRRVGIAVRCLSDHSLHTASFVTLPQEEKKLKLLSLAAEQHNFEDVELSSLLSMRHEAMTHAQHQHAEADQLMHLSHRLRSELQKRFISKNLLLKQVNMTDSDGFLKKLMHSDRVRPTDSLDSFKKRLENARRCYLLVHPSLPHEPVAFVQAALTTKPVMCNIQEVLEKKVVTPEDESSPATVVFYSISSIHPALRGVEVGATLIKKAAAHIVKEHPTISTVMTLSPIPGFVPWLHSETIPNLNEILHDQQSDKNKDQLLHLCAKYLAGRSADGESLDKVAGFHLGNGACLHRLHWRADSSSRGLLESAGILVNYRYSMSAEERTNNAKKYAEDPASHPAADPEFLQLLKRGPRL